MNLIGYARVSTSGQTLDAQLEPLGAAGCAALFKETISGARSDQPELKKALDTALLHGPPLH
jgi:DNA invertase Pin-like site-specific DNA recombinase